MDQENGMEQYWQQLRAMGLSEEAIEMYRRQMGQSVNFTNDWVKQLKQFSDNMQQFNNLFTGDMDLEDTILPQQQDIRLSPATALSRDQQWAVACGGDVAFANGQYLDDLTTGLGKQQCRQLLSEWWDIDSTEELQEMISWLYDSGHRVEYDVIWQALNTVSVKESKAFLREYVTANALEEKTAIERLRNMRDALELFKERNLLDSAVMPDMLIWDYARIINLCRGGFDAGYIDRQSALDQIMACAAPLKRAYTSWKHLSLSYQFARCVWGGVDASAFEAFQENMQQLLTAPQSPWVRLPW